VNVQRNPHKRREVPEVEPVGDAADAREWLERERPRGDPAGRQRDVADHHGACERDQGEADAVHDSRFQPQRRTDDDQTDEQGDSGGKQDRQRTREVSARDPGWQCGAADGQSAADEQLVGAGIGTVQSKQRCAGTTDAEGDPIHESENGARDSHGKQPEKRAVDEAQNRQQH